MTRLALAGFGFIVVTVPVLVGLAVGILILEVWIMRLRRKFPGMRIRRLRRKFQELDE